MGTINAEVVLAALDNILEPMGMHSDTHLSIMRHRVQRLRDQVHQHASRKPEAAPVKPCSVCGMAPEADTPSHWYQWHDDNCSGEVNEPEAAQSDTDLREAIKLAWPDDGVQSYCDCGNLPITDDVETALVEAIRPLLSRSQPVQVEVTEHDHDWADGICQFPTCDSVILGRVEVTDEVRRLIAAAALREAASEFSKAAAAGVEPVLNRLAAKLLLDRARRHYGPIDSEQTRAALGGGDQ